MGVLSDNTNSSSLSASGDFLKLDFNERSDKNNPLTSEYPFGDLLWQYPDRQPLEKKIADLNNLSSDQVLCTNGGDEAIMILMRIIKEGTPLILPLPAFSQYTWGVKSWKQQAVLIDGQSNLAIDIDATLVAINNSKQSVTILTRPNNPTGESISIETLKTFLETAKKQSSWIFLDEAYIEFSDESSVASSLLNQYDNLVILRTFSKAYGLAGIRLGYLMGAEALIEPFRERCMPFNIPTPSLQIALRAMQESNQLEMKNYCQTIRENRQKISSWLVSIGVKVFPSQANFLLLKLPTNQAKAVKSFLAKNRILLRTFTEGELIDCLRISIPYCIERLFDLLKQALQPQLICLDMDGVLIDTSSSYDEATKATVLQLSNNTIVQSQIDDLKRRGGYNNDWVLTKRLLDDLNCQFSLDEVTKVFQEIYVGKNNDGLMNNEVPLIQSALVSKINQSTKTQFAVVTGRPYKEATIGKKLVNLNELELVSLDDVELPKPSPEGIQKLQKRFSSSSWMCGDNLDDMQAAVGSNSLAIGIGEENQDILYQAGADIVLKSINDLEEWLCPINQ